MQSLQTKPNSTIRGQQRYIKSINKEEKKTELKFSDYMGHLLFIATAFNWFLVFVLMQIHGNIYVTEVTPIREFEMGLTLVVCGFAFFWFFKKIKTEPKK